MTQPADCNHLFSMDGIVCLYCGAQRPDALGDRIRQIVREEISKHDEDYFVSNCTCGIRFSVPGAGHIDLKPLQQ